MKLKMTVKFPPVCGIECEDCSLAVEVKRLLGSILTTSGFQFVGGEGGGVQEVDGVELHVDKNEEKEHILLLLFDFH